MTHRLSHITTRTGDDGTTGLADGSRLSKAAPRVEAIGSIDELNAHLGLLIAFEPPPPIASLLQEIQQRLFDLGGELATPGALRLDAALAAWLDDQLEALNADLPPLAEFILPGGGRCAAQCHVARTVCRRAERRLLALREAEPINPYSLQFLNRLSDLLFVISRRLAREHGTEVLWQPLEAR